jgi:hypothetical protein
MANGPKDRASKQDQLLALAWVRGEVGVTEVAHAYRLPETSTGEIYDRLAQALKAWLVQREGKNVIGLDAQTGSPNSTRSSVYFSWVRGEGLRRRRGGPN